MRRGGEAIDGENLGLRSKYAHEVIRCAVGKPELARSVFLNIVRARHERIGHEIALGRNRAGPVLNRGGVAKNDHTRK